MSLPAANLSAQLPWRDAASAPAPAPKRSRGEEVAEKMVGIGCEKYVRFLDDGKFLDAAIAAGRSNDLIVERVRRCYAGMLDAEILRAKRVTKAAIRKYFIERARHARARTLGDAAVRFGLVADLIEAFDESTVPDLEHAAEVERALREGSK